jgi:hypothetical protein
MENMTAGRKELHNEEQLHNLQTYASSNNNMMQGVMGGSRSTLGQIRNAYNVLVGKLEGTRHLARLEVDECIILK